MLITIFTFTYSSEKKRNVHIALDISNSAQNISLLQSFVGARGSVVVKALLTGILSVALGPGVYSASNRNEHQKH
jgi:hypothetical protein